MTKYSDIEYVVIREKAASYGIMLGFFSGLIYCIATSDFSGFSIFNNMGHGACFGAGTGYGLGVIYTKLDVVVNNYLGESIDDAITDHPEE
ncbi:hypothetical protein ACFL1H_05870 [Nanoarchaeota archaeon]